MKSVLTSQLSSLTLKVETLNTTVGRRLDKLEERLDTTNLRVEKLEKLLKESPDTEASVKFKLGELEKQLLELKEG